MGFERPVILCVDDSDSGLSLRKAVLEQEGYRVYLARDIESAIAVCRRLRPSLVISDHMLRGESGTDLAARIKQESPTVPVMLISGTQPDTLLNIDCFLHKGEPVSKMLAMVDDLVKRVRA
jgi:two-component system alkaline phosphatase synthesis response regulator PhoP